MWSRWEEVNHIFDLIERSCSLARPISCPRLVVQILQHSLSQGREWDKTFQNYQCQLKFQLEGRGCQPAGAPTHLTRKDDCGLSVHLPVSLCHCPARHSTRPWVELTGGNKPRPVLSLGFTAMGTAKATSRFQPELQESSRATTQHSLALRDAK